MTSNLEKIKEIILRDKRFCERLDLPLKIRYRPESSPETMQEGWSTSVWLDNIGGEGLGFSSDLGFQIGDKMDIELTIPTDTSPFFFGAEVVWVQENEDPKHQLHPGRYYYGLRFYRLDETARRKFEEFISDNILDKYLDEQGQIRDM